MVCLCVSELFKQTHLNRIFVNMRVCVCVCCLESVGDRKPSQLAKITLKGPGGANGDGRYRVGIRTHTRTTLVKLSLAFLRLIEDTCLSQYIVRFIYKYSL